METGLVVTQTAFGLAEFDSLEPHERKKDLMKRKPKAARSVKLKPPTTRSIDSEMVRETLGAEDAGRVPGGTMKRKPKAARPASKEGR